MPKLNQIVAIANGKKSRLEKERDSIYKKLQKKELVAGIARTYQPDAEDGEPQPDERKNIQYSVPQAADQFASVMTDLMDVIATQDWNNCEARADVVVDGSTLLKDVPVTNLMFLEKQLVDIHTFVNHMPTLDPAEDWNWSEEAECYRSDASKTVKTKKVRKNHVLAEATKEHKAQVEVFTEDERVGEWTTHKFSGAVPASQKTAMLDRVRKLQDAVKCAREEANSKDAELIKIGADVFGYILAPMKK